MVNRRQASEQTYRKVNSALTDCLPLDIYRRHHTLFRACRSARRLSPAHAANRERCNELLYGKAGGRSRDGRRRGNRGTSGQWWAVGTLSVGIQKLLLPLETCRISGDDFGVYPLLADWRRHRLVEILAGQERLFGRSLQFRARAVGSSRRMEWFRLLRPYRLQPADERIWHGFLGLFELQRQPCLR